MPRSPFANARAPRATLHPALDPTVLSAGEDDQLQRLLRDLRLGLPVALATQGASMLLAAVETLGDDRCRAMASTGAAELVLTRRRAAALGRLASKVASEVASETDEVLRIPVPADADRAWLAALAGLDALADLATTDPGPPTRPVPLERGTVEQATAIALVRASCLLPAVVTIPLVPGGEPEGVLTLSRESAATALDRLPPQARVSVASLPTDVSETGRVHAFRPVGGGSEHYVIEIGTPDFGQPVPVRLHSACFTGDVLGSLKCDCGSQLRAAMASMAADGGGVLLYLDQEGRGIGLANKIRAYALQDAGLDTVEANHWLGFEDDHRDFRVGAQLLRSLGIGRVRLLTNNPAKVEMLAEQGIEVVERVPLTVGATTHNAQYLATKAAKSGHLL